ncbi:MAG: tRNA 2-selenouridine(34) synthase MnmH [Burkholderiales bacterium]|nr:tRNA 2-selenouridine(34) synthase MnmH [Burkholderiales bacterium]
MHARAEHSVAIAPGLLAGFDAILDVRSPAEYAEDHLPGAENAPVLEDAERARVGTLYRASPFEARKLGAALVARNIARHLETRFAARPRTWRPLVYCWRGGKRSAAMAHVLREVGWDAKTLAGGYKAWRRYVVARLAALPARFRFRVVHGMTGAGKSRLLEALVRAGAQVLDLEALAEHRGSVLGELPGRAQPSQKAFETRLLVALEALDPAREVFLEAESRRIGRVQLPEALVARMRDAECVLLETAREARVALLMDDYRHFFADPTALAAQLDGLARLHGRARVAEWKALAARGEWRALVARLLEEHYDPAYRRSSQAHYARLGKARRLAIDSAEPAAFAAAAEELAREARATV